MRIPGFNFNGIRLNSWHQPLLWVILGRLLLLSVVMIILIGFTEYDVDLAGLAVFMAITMALSVAYACWLRNEETKHNCTLYQFTVDVFIVTGLVHFTGGITSTLSLLYPLAILVAAVVVSGSLAGKVALLSVCLYATLIILEAVGALPYRGIEPGAYDQPARVAQLTMLQILIFSLFGGASHFIAERYFFQSHQLERLRSMTKTTLASVAIPLLAVEKPAGLIKLVNPTACRMLKRTEEQLVGANFQDLFVDQVPSLYELTDNRQNKSTVRPEDGQQIWWMRQGGGEKFPASLEISGGTLPGAVLSVLHEGPQEAEISLVAFYDMTQIMAKEEDIRNWEKTHTAVGMITEMAHVVRNPLTAIRGAGELINAAVETALSKQHQITEEEFAMLKSMCEIIFDQTQELNNKVESFMQYAVNDRHKLLDFINNANVWGERVVYSGDK